MSIAFPIAARHGRRQIAPATIAHVLNLVQQSCAADARLTPVLRARAPAHAHPTLRTNPIRPCRVKGVPVRSGHLSSSRAVSGSRGYVAVAEASAHHIPDDHHDHQHHRSLEYLRDEEEPIASSSYIDGARYDEDPRLTEPRLSTEEQPHYSRSDARSETIHETLRSASMSERDKINWSRKLLYEQVRKPPRTLRPSEYAALEEKAKMPKAYLYSRARLERMLVTWLDGGVFTDGDYLADAMRAVYDAQDSAVDAATRRLAMALGSLAMVQESRESEAQGLFDRLDRHRSSSPGSSEEACNLLAITDGVMALALVKMGAWNESHARMSDSLRSALQAKSIGKRFSATEATVLATYFAYCHSVQRDDQILSLVRDNQRVLRHPLGAGKADKRNRSLAEVIFAGLRRIADPAQVFEQGLSRTDSEHYGPDTNDRRVGHILLNALVGHREHIDTALALVSVMKDNNIPLQPDALLQLARVAVELDVAMASSVARDILRTEVVPLGVLKGVLDLHRAGLAGDVIRAAYDRLAEARYRFAQHELLVCARAFAAAGDVGMVSGILDDAFGSDERSVQRLGILFAAQASTRDVDAAQNTFEEIWSIKPSVPVAERMLALHASRGDLESTVQLFDLMVDIGLQPTVRGYTTLISLFAHRRDLINAKNVFQVMVDSGVQPDAVAWAAILNAEVEVGEWTKAALRWSALPEKLKGHAAVVSVILKAYVLLSAPTDQVMALFRAVRSPNAFHWSYAIQSALDNDDLDLGQDLFLEMDQRAKADPSAPRPNVFTFSILLHAYLRRSMSDSAKGVYEEMTSREIVPTGVTYGMVIASSTTASSGSSLLDAQDFAMSLYRQATAVAGRQAIRSRDSIAEPLFGPLIESAGRSGDTESVHQFQDMIPEESVTVKTYTQLMDAYRRASDPDSVLAIWDKAFDLACETTAMMADERAGLHLGRSRANLLCIPLSIVLDAMSAAGRYEDVKRVWKQVADAGFSYDSQNYNHLAIALARTGEIEGAFALVHKIILPRAKEVRSRRSAALRQSESARYDPDYDEPDEYYSYDNGDEDEHYQSVEPVFAPPNRRHQHRWDGLDIFRRSPPVEGGEPSSASAGSASSAAAATNIEILQNWRPSDVLWHPNYMTLTVLDLAYSQLEDARRSGAWLALANDEADADPDNEDIRLQAGEATDTSGKPTTTTDDAGTPHASPDKAVTFPAFHNAPMRSTSGTVSTATPMSMIVRLNRKYLRVVSLISLHRRKRAVRMAREQEERRAEGRR